MPQDDAVEAVETAEVTETSGATETAVPPEALRAQLVELLGAGGMLTDPAVERAMRVVPRHLFVPHAAARDAYADIAIPTRFEDGIPVSSASQPAVVAIMLQQMHVEPGMHILEIGAGTGYNAALLAELTGPDGSVTTLDIDHAIVDDARAHLAAAGYSQVLAVAADGAFGWPEGAPYDRIMLTVGAWDIAPAWLQQLSEGGMLVLPLWMGGVEASVAFRKRDGALHSESVAPCGFMRLRGAEAGPERWMAVAANRKLFAERADEIAPDVSMLLARRPRRRIWTRPTTALLQFLQYLGMRGYHVVSLYADNQKPRPSRRPRARWGIYAVDADGPSLVLFSALPMMLVFGGGAAERIIEQQAARWSATAQQPLERTRVVARSLADADQVPVAEGAFRVLRRHFAYDVTL